MKKKIHYHVFCFVGLDVASKETMRSKVKKIGATVIVLICWIMAGQSFCGTEGSVKENPIDESAYLESLINQARKNPLAMAAMIGKDPEQVIRDFPEKKLMLQYGLPPVISNTKLLASAGKHTEDMFVNQYFAYCSLDERKPIDRMQAEGYRVLFSGETLGMMGFYNLINPEDAVWALFKKMLAEELDPNRKDPWIILNPSISEVGVSVGKGTFSINGQALNVYLGVCDFGSSRSDVYAAERMLWKSINSARTNPIGYGLETAGVSFQEAISFLGKENAWKLIIGLPPLAWNSTLHHVSRSQQVEDTEDIEGVVFYDDDRVSFIDSYDYQAVAAAEIRLSFYDDNPDMKPVQAAAKLFEQLLKTEMGNGPEKMLNIYNESFTEIGTAIECTPVADRQGFRWSAVIEFARPLEDRQFVIGALTIAQSDSSTAQSVKNVKKKIGRQMILSKVFNEEIEGSSASETFLSPQLAYSDPLGGYQFEFDNSTTYNLQVMADDGHVVYNDYFESYHNRNQTKDVVVGSNGNNNI